MGRQTKRVPLDFDWPQGKTWEGYLMPDRFDGAKCPDCERGSTPDGELLQGIAYMLVGLADDVVQQGRGRDLHPYLQPIHDISYVSGRPRPTPAFEEFVKGLHPEDRGYDMLGRQPYAMYHRLIELAGLPKDWGTCPTCKGHGSVEKYEGQRGEAEAWEYVEPPVGEGWQMWETTSEGSPMSPVFPTAEGLAHWLWISGASLFGDRTATYEDWLAIVKGEQMAMVKIAPGVVMM